MGVCGITDRHWIRFSIWATWRRGDGGAGHRRDGLDRNYLDEVQPRPVSTAHGDLLARAAAPAAALAGPRPCSKVP